VAAGSTVAEIWRFFDLNMAFFDFSRRRSPPSWIIKIGNFLRSYSSRGLKCVALSNLVEIGQIAAEIRRFFDFKTVAAAILDF